MQYNQSKYLNQSAMTTKSVNTTFSSQPDQAAPGSDYVNAFVVNDAGKVLIIENRENGRGWNSWQVVGRSLETDEDPILAVQQDLRHRTGFACNEWIYLGTFVLDENRPENAGHFFCANDLVKVAAPQTDNPHDTIKWISKEELKQALLDGRIATLKHAIAVCLAMVVCS